MPVSAASDVSPRDVKPTYVIAWLLCALFYLYQYATRSAPGVMQSLLSTSWGGNHIGSMISGYYVAYALTALAAGVLLDRFGASRVLPYATAVVAAGCLIFAQGSETAGMVGFVLQAIGAVFSFIGSSYVAARYLPARTYATNGTMHTC
jgi:MFS family permease